MAIQHHLMLVSCRPAGNVRNSGNLDPQIDLLNN